MADAPLTRRAFVRAAGVALGAAALPAGITTALAAETPPTRLAGAAPLAFDAAAFVADLEAAGFTLWTSARQDDRGRRGYGIGPGADGRFGGKPYCAVMERWSDAIDACPDHVDRVVAHLVERTSTPQVPT